MKINGVVTLGPRTVRIYGVRWLGTTPTSDSLYTLPGLFHIEIPIDQDMSSHRMSFTVEGASIFATPPHLRRRGDHLYHGGGTLVYLGPFGEGPEPTVPRNLPIEKRAPSDYTFILPYEASRIPDPDNSIAITLWQGSRPGPFIIKIPPRGDLATNGLEISGRIGSEEPNVCHIPGNGYAVVTNIMNGQREKRISCGSGSYHAQEFIRSTVCIVKEHMESLRHSTGNGEPIATQVPKHVRDLLGVEIDWPWLLEDIPYECLRLLGLIVEESDEGPQIIPVLGYSPYPGTRVLKAFNQERLASANVAPDEHALSLWI
ncbi:hypothetical protein BKA70DRAFT_382930 [Coprinopsis sp. MPI-PUGE-AT-0042]|nr:hypothetical protein BKA70DRAFT_382930 [Coprinopsis sp. MPI-PUGE-AT-0042]